MYELRIREARAGDSDAALWLIKQLLAEIRGNRDVNGVQQRGKDGKFKPTVVDQRLLDYFYDCFSELWLKSGHRVADLATVSDALNLTGKGKAGPKVKSSIKQEMFDLGLLVMYQLAIERDKPKAVGLSPLERALEIVANDENISVDRARRGYKVFKAAMVK